MYSFLFLFVCFCIKLVAPYYYTIYYYSHFLKNLELETYMCYTNYKYMSFKNVKKRNKNLNFRTPPIKEENFILAE